MLFYLCLNLFLFLYILPLGFVILKKLFKKIILDSYCIINENIPYIRGCKLVGAIAVLYC